MATPAPALSLHVQNSPRVLIVQAAPGKERRCWIERRVREVAAPQSRTWLLACDFAQGGPWAGVTDFFTSLVPEILAKDPGLVERHALELCHAMPQLRRSLILPHPTLTDLSPRKERIRNYAPDRALRIVHGLIDFLDGCKTASGMDAPWIIGCHSYDQAGFIARRFLSEFMRRRSERMNIYLVIGVGPGEAAAVQASFASGVSTEVISVDLPAHSPALPAADAAAQLAHELETTIGDDLLEKRIALPELVRLWQRAARPDKVLRYRYFGLDTYNLQGLYADAFRYGDGLVQMAAQYAPQDKLLRWRIMVTLLNCYIGMQQAQAGLQLAEGEAARFVQRERPLWRGQLCYWIAMLYARHSRPRNLAKGEEFLDQGLAWIQKDKELPEADLHFNSVFNRNGLALIRNFQGRYQEAIELCRSGIVQLNAHLDPEKHRLQRSVLIYNIAQVYVASGEDEPALRYYADAMEMDPNYSEYYNERGNILLRLGRTQQAHADYLRAIQLGPPYSEVFTNLGQCCRRMARMPEAIQAYSRALDLEPGQVLALLGRAKAQEELGLAEPAIADYTAALEQDSALWEALAGRGVLHYENNNFKAALADFDRAIQLNPENADLHQNRAIVLADLGCHRQAVDDLQFALGLNPGAEDIPVLQQRLQAEMKLASSSQS